ncbi:hypothetical protein ID866_8142 [Astraeus odoratus]|nr:hypothetical protein ID866_8142 [Astraeus odoratus]
MGIIPWPGSNALTATQVERRSMITTPTPLDKSPFILNSSAVAGILGGEEAMSTAALVHIFEGSRWLGRYNSPGSYVMSHSFARLAESGVCVTPPSGITQVQTDPTVLFESYGWKSPQFRSVYPRVGMVQEAGPLAAIFMRRCASLPGIMVNGRRTRPVGVTIAELNHTPALQESLNRLRIVEPLYSILPIFISIGTCIACAVYRDWYSFSMILLGIVACGISCFVIGSGTFLFTRPESSEGSLGDGILSSDGEIVLLKGGEGAVISITHGRFWLRLSFDAIRALRHCSAVLMTQAIAQLILIPQGSFFGQLMFLVSLVVSWTYNLWLSGLSNAGSLQGEILVDRVLRKPRLVKYVLGTHTSMVVFVLLVFKLKDPDGFMNNLLPSDNSVWKKFKSTIADRLKRGQDLRFDASDWSDKSFSEEERSSLKDLLEDAQAAYNGFEEHKQQFN